MSGTRSARGAAEGAEDMSTAERLIEAARLCLLEEGGAATSLKTIAARAGVNHGLIHRHFGSKEELLIAVLRAAEHSLPQLSGESAVGDARKIMQDKIFEHQRVYMELLSFSFQMPHLRQVFLEGTKQVLPEYRSYVGAKDDADALRFGATVMGLAIYHAISADLPVQKAMERLLADFKTYPASDVKDA